jgi:hypothetical protein
MFYLFPFEFVCRSAPSFSFCLVFLGVAGASVCDLPHLTRSKASKEAALLALLPHLTRSKATVRQAAVISHLSPVLVKRVKKLLYSLYCHFSLVVKQQ